MKFTASFDMIYHTFVDSLEKTAKIKIHVLRTFCVEIRVLILGTNAIRAKKESLVSVVIKVSFQIFFLSVHNCIIF